MYRDLPWEVACVLIWSLLALVNFERYGFDVTFGLAGILVGLFVAVPATNWWLGRLDAKGEVRPNRRTLVLAVVGIAALIFIYTYVGVAGGLAALLSLSALVYALLPSYWGMRTLFVFRWEQSHRKRVMIDGFTVTRAIPVT